MSYPRIPSRRRASLRFLCSSLNGALTPARQRGPDGVVSSSSSSCESFPVDSRGFSWFCLTGAGLGVAPSCNRSDVRPAERRPSASQGRRPVRAVLTNRNLTQW